MEINYISHNQLLSYLKCSQHYHYKYKSFSRSPEEPKTFAQIKGLLFHKCCEIYLKDLDPLKEHPVKKETFQLAVEEWLQEEFKFDSSCIDFFSFINSISNYADLITRASIRGSEPLIRNKDGSIPKNLELYPPPDFTREVYLQNLDSEKSMWDLFFRDHISDLGYGSIYFLIAEVYSYFESFFLPEDFSKVLAVEEGVSTEEHNLVELPGHPEVHIRGYIDFKYLTGYKDRHLIDFKVTEHKPSEQEVLENVQLNLYAYLEQQVHGSYPKKMGIYHAPTAEYILVTPNEFIIVQTLEYLISFYQASISSKPMRHHPQEYNSPCRYKEYKTGVVIECPYLSKCW